MPEIVQKHKPEAAHPETFVGGSCTCGKGPVCPDCYMCLACGRMDFGLPMILVGCHFCGKDMAVRVGVSCWWVCDECRKDPTRRRYPVGMETAWVPERLRAFEEEIKDIFLEGRICGPVHLSGGNEAPLIEIFKEVNPGDWVFSTHRSHYHALLTGVPPELVKAEILKGRSIHLNFKAYNFISSAIVGGCLPVAVGVAMGMKRRGDERKVWAFIGDMAYEAGIVHECIKYAKNFKLPMCVVVEDNGLSTNTPTMVVWRNVYEETRFQNVRTVEDWGVGKVVEYSYKRIYPHIGCGEWVTFS